LLAGNPEPIIEAVTNPSGPATEGVKLVSKIGTVILEMKSVIAYPTYLI
jgi:hypothetical protein